VQPHRYEAHWETLHLFVHLADQLFALPKHAVSEAMDEINDRWGEFVVTPALMMGMDGQIVTLADHGRLYDTQDMGLSPGSQSYRSR
jgi:hypothetical protein